ncbi:MAG: transcription termination/antitermination NusG family protein [Desulfatiglandales bacterium]
MDKWYVVQTKPKKESRVEFYLGNDGIESFLPLYQNYTYRFGRNIKMITPLFPGYIFVRFDLEPQHYSVRWTRGVTRILGMGLEPIPVDDLVIEIIKSRVDNANVVKQGKAFRRGDRVRIKAGPLKDLLGIFETKISDAGRVKILLTLIGYQASVELHESQLEKLTM